MQMYCRLDAVYDGLWRHRLAYYESGGQEFESLRARQQINKLAEQGDRSHNGGLRPANGSKLPYRLASGASDVGASLRGAKARRCKAAVWRSGLAGGWPRE
jgi:hypothetical protein